MDFDEEDEETYNRQHLNDEVNGINNKNHDDNHEVINKSQPYSTTVNNKTKTSTKLSVQDNNQSNEQQTGVEQQDEWEEFEGVNSKYEQLRLKFTRGANDQNNGDEDEDNDDYYEDGNNHNTNNDDNTNNTNKDKHVWKMDQVKQTESIPINESNDAPIKETEEAPPTATKSSVYRPPHSRGNNSSITIVSGTHQRTSKKEKPNLASTEDFPTLGAAVNKK
jgi:hypothetical protein